jgi:hypothetical protein
MGTKLIPWWKTLPKPQKQYTAAGLQATASKALALRDKRRTPVTFMR